MKTRDAVLAYQELCGDTDTKTLDLNVQDPVSAIEIEVEAPNGAVSNLDNSISDIVTSVQVVDGAEVLFSMNMKQLEALEFYKTYRPPKMIVSEWGGETQLENTMILFGRRLYDPSLCFVPSNYRNPQLKISFNKAAIRAAGDTGFASGTNIKLSVVAKVIEDGASPQGFLMQKVVDSFVSASSGDKRVDLPTDYPYRMIVLRAYKQGSDIDGVITNVKLSADSDKYVPFNRKVSQLDAWALNEYGLFQVKHGIYRADNSNVRLIVNKDPSCLLNLATGTAPKFLWVVSQAGGQATVHVYNAAGSADSTRVNLDLVETGHAPYGTVPIVFGMGDDPSTWFDPRPYGKLELVLTQGVADAEVEVVVEQLMT